ncbi:TIR domain-containing protein [Halomonas sp. IOP_14]|uniref:TIR domain-containing anti-phage reverse transcriptase n=1 Tax=Halomonas sp. IOP_14 TaxID=2873295 RepID=UPI001E3B83B7|nr:TIR domain-containing anti-phage reverse transcriptase [Halomonas sp. IOP_14]MCD1584726.1 TIR domain-containing protein [Halomonas sp. IOP_14]
MKLLNPSSRSIAKLNSLDELCNLLGINKGHLLFICYKRPDELKYKSFEMRKKRGGFRKIDSPQKGLRVIQGKLAELLEENVEFKTCVQGFVKERGVLENATLHKKSNWVLNVDIKNFFGSINFGRVRAVFVAKPFEIHPDVATVIAQICCFKNYLPQGAATSPIVSNIVASTLDNQIIRRIRNHRLLYSRYADDITISAKRVFPRELAYISEGRTIVGEDLVNIFSRASFEINQKKSRLQSKYSRQEVTGLIVNRKVNVPAEYKNKLRAAIHHWVDDPREAERKYYVDILGLTPEEAELTDDGSKLRRNIYGRLSFLNMVKGGDDPTYIKLILKMAEHDPLPPKFVKNIKAEYKMYDVFLCHASEDKADIVEPLYQELSKIGVHAFYDKKEIGWGDSLVGTINKALLKSKYVIAVMTDNSVGKSWPQQEINSVLNGDISGGTKRLLPLIFGDKEKILNNNFLMNDKLYVEWKDNPTEIAQKVQELLAQKSNE